MVLGYTDQTRQHRGRREHTLLYRNGKGELLAQCTARSFKRHLTFAGPDGAPASTWCGVARPVIWEAPWVRAGLTETEREALGGLLVLALLWV